MMTDNNRPASQSHTMTLSRPTEVAAGDVPELPAPFGESRDESQRHQRGDGRYGPGLGDPQQRLTSAVPQSRDGVNISTRATYRDGLDEARATQKGGGPRPRQAAHDLGQREPIHPALLDGPAGLRVDQRGIRGQIGELQPAGLGSRPSHWPRPPASRLLGRNSTQRAVRLVAWMRSNGDGSPPSLDVHDGLAGVEQVAALLLEQCRDEPGVVDRVGPRCG